MESSGCGEQSVEYSFHSHPVSVLAVRAPCPVRVEARRNPQYPSTVSLTLSTSELDRHNQTRSLAHSCGTTARLNSRLPVIPPLSRNPPPANTRGEILKVKRERRRATRVIEATSSRHPQSKSSKLMEYLSRNITSTKASETAAPRESILSNPPVEDASSQDENTLIPSTRAPESVPVESILSVRHSKEEECPQSEEQAQNVPISEEILHSEKEKPAVSGRVLQSESEQSTPRLTESTPVTIKNIEGLDLLTTESEEMFMTTEDAGSSGGAHEAPITGTLFENDTSFYTQGLEVEAPPASSLTQSNPSNPEISKANLLVSDGDNEEVMEITSPQRVSLPPSEVQFGMGETFSLPEQVTIPDQFQLGLDISVGPSSPNNAGTTAVDDNEFDGTICNVYETTSVTIACPPTRKRLDCYQTYSGFQASGAEIHGCKRMSGVGDSIHRRVCQKPRTGFRKRSLFEVSDQNIPFYRYEKMSNTRPGTQVGFFHYVPPSGRSEKMVRVECEVTQLGKSVCRRAEEEEVCVDDGEGRPVTIDGERYMAMRIVRSGKTWTIAARYDVCIKYVLTHHQLPSQPFVHTLLIKTGRRLVSGPTPELSVEDFIGP